MTEVNCCNRQGCALFSVIISIIAGAVATLLTVTAAVTVTPVFYWVIFGIAVAFLLASFLTVSRRNLGECTCLSLRLFLAGILGTVTAALVLLGVGFVATSILGAIITGILVLSFSLFITSAVCIVRSAVDCD